MNRKRRLSEINPAELQAAEGMTKTRKVPLKLFLQSFLLISVFIVVMSICLVLYNFIDTTAADVGNQLAIKYASNVVSKTVAQLSILDRTASWLLDSSNSGANLKEGNGDCDDDGTPGSAMKFWLNRFQRVQAISNWGFDDVSVCLKYTAKKKESKNEIPTSEASDSDTFSGSDEESDGVSNSYDQVIHSSTEFLLVYSMRKDGRFFFNTAPETEGAALPDSAIELNKTTGAFDSQLFTGLVLNTTSTLRDPATTLRSEITDQLWWNKLVSDCLQNLERKVVSTKDDTSSYHWGFFPQDSDVTTSQQTEADKVMKGNSSGNFAEFSSYHDDSTDLIKSTARLSKWRSPENNSLKNQTCFPVQVHAVRVTKTLERPSDLTVDALITVETTTAVRFNGTILYVVSIPGGGSSSSLSDDKSDGEEDSNSWRMEQNSGSVAHLPAISTSLIGRSSGTKTFDPRVYALNRTSLETGNREEVIAARDVIDSVPRFADLVVADCYLTEETLNGEIKQGSRMLVLSSIIIATVVSVAASLFIHILVEPMLTIRDEMIAVGKLEGLDTIAERKSSISELSDISVYLRELADHVGHIKKALESETDNGGLETEVSADIPRQPSNEFDSTMRAESDFLGATANNFSLASLAHSGYDDTLRIQQSLSVHSTLILLTYESRSRADVIATAEFELVYVDQETEDLLQKLTKECKESVEEHPFEEMTLVHIDPETQEEVLLRSAMQLQELLSTSPSKLEITMYKARSSQYRMLVTPVADSSNFLVTAIFVLRLVQAGQHLTATAAFCALYVFALGMNAAVSFGLLRSSSENFQKWIAQASVEMALAMTVSVLNPQNMQLMWSQIRLKKYLRFNAPEDSKLAQRSMSWSLFGFLFSDVAQLMFKVWLLYVATSIDVFNFFALITSGVAVAFNLVLRLHAMFLWHSTSVNDADPFGSVYAGEHATECGQLVKKEVTLVHVFFPIPNHVQLVNLQGFEYNTFYTTVFATLKAHRGSVLWAHGGDVVGIFNVHKKSENHTLDALSFAHNTISLGKSKGQQVVAGICTGTYPVGMLGTVTNKTLHCFGPLNHLSRLVSNAYFNGGEIVMNKEAARRMRTLRAELRDIVADYEAQGLIIKEEHEHTELQDFDDLDLPVVGNTNSKTEGGVPGGGSNSSAAITALTTRKMTGSRSIPISKRIEPKVVDDQITLQFLERFRFRRAIGILPNRLPIVGHSNKSLGYILSQSYLVSQHGEEVSRDFRLAQVAYALLGAPSSSTSINERGRGGTEALQYVGPSGGGASSNTGIDRLRLERRVKLVCTFYMEWCRKVGIPDSDDHRGGDPQPNLRTARNLLVTADDVEEGGADLEPPPRRSLSTASILHASRRGRIDL